MAVTLSPRIALAVLFAALIVVTAGSIVTTELIGRDEGPDPAFHFVELEDGTVLWPHHSAAPDYTTRTLPITVVIYGDAPATERLLMERGIGDWEELPEDQEDIEPSETPTATEGAGTAWDPAGGTVRLSFISPRLAHAFDGRTTLVFWSLSHAPYPLIPVYNFTYSSMERHST